MIRSRMTVGIGTLVAVSLGGVVEAQMMPSVRRSYGILVSDTALDAVFLLKDRNNNGTADDPGEATVYFDASNQSGIPAPTGSVFSIVQGRDGSVYVSDGDSDSVYRLRDLNGDGNANGPGEATLWYRSSVGFYTPTPNGLAIDSTGAVYITNAGAAGFPSAVFRTVDLDGDGAAMTEGEVSLWIDTAALITSSTPFDITFIGDSAYFADLRGSQPDAIFRARDVNHDGMIDASELNIFIDDSNTLGVPCGFSSVTDGVSLYTHETTGSVNPQRVFRLTDLNHDGVITAGEATEVWNETFVPAGLAMANSFDIAVGAGKLAVLTNGTDLQDNVFVARDLSGDGTYLQAGETVAFITAHGTALPETVRAVCFIASPCPADWNGDGASNSADFFDFVTAFFSVAADFNGDGVTNSADFFDFVTAFFTPC